MLDNNQESFAHRPIFDQAKKAVEAVLVCDISSNPLLEPVVVKINQNHLTINKNQVQPEIEMNAQQGTVQYKNRAHLVSYILNRKLQALIETIKDNGGLEAMSEENFKEALKEATTCNILSTSFQSPILLSNGYTLDIRVLSNLLKDECPFTRQPLTDDILLYENRTLSVLQKICLQHYPDLIVSCNTLTTLREPLAAQQDTAATYGELRRQDTINREREVGRERAERRAIESAQLARMSEIARAERRRHDLCLQAKAAIWFTYNCASFMLIPEVLIPELERITDNKEGCNEGCIAWQVILSLFLVMPFILGLYALPRLVDERRILPRIPTLAQLQQSMATCFSQASSFFTCRARPSTTEDDIEARLITPAT